MINPLYFLQKGLWTLVSLTFILLTGVSVSYFYLVSQLPEVNVLREIELQQPLRIYTQDGQLIQEYGDKRRIPIAYRNIPKTLIQAILVTEDQRFFEHAGVDFLGLGRAALHMIQTGTKSQGGSTITMQLARNFFLTRKKTFLRKFNEILLAMKIERELTKEKILELYLNVIYLGNHAYGVGAASVVYFGKPLNQLSLSQLAMIAGLPQAPSAHNPFNNPEAAEKRRNHVLLRLLEEKNITGKQYQQAIKEPVSGRVHRAFIEINAPYVAEMVRQWLYQRFGEKIYTQGYKVYTTVQSNLQKAANQALVQHVMAYDKRHGYRGVAAHLTLNDSSLVKKAFKTHSSIGELLPAMVLAVKAHQAEAILADNRIITLHWEGISWARPALKNGWVGKLPTQAYQVLRSGDLIYVKSQENHWQLTQIPEVEAALVALNPNNGAIKALVGGFDFQKSNFNRATQSIRQPGSSFKPFIYAAALNKGYTLATLVKDAPITVDDPSQADMWRPHNVNHAFNGPTRLKEALVHSQNLVSIRVLDDIGFDYAIDFLSQFGFKKSILPKALSLALGSLSISPLELTSAYAVFANGGFRTEPYFIESVVDNSGKKIFQSSPLLACNDCNFSIKNQAVRAIPNDVIFLINSALKDVIQRGTAQAAKTLNRYDLAGKTGTTNDQVDAWFAGFNPNLVVTAWVGYDNPRSLHEYAANLALPMWIDFMKTVLPSQKIQDFVKPPEIIAQRIDPISGLASNQDNAIMEYFSQKNLQESRESNANGANNYTVEIQAAEANL